MSSSPSPSSSFASIPAAYSALSLVGKVALITGASSGIGAATARLFASRGAKVVIASRREAESQAIVADIRRLGGDALFVKTDVSKENDVKHAVEATVEKYGRLDIAFNNAGVFGSSVPTHETTLSTHQHVLDVNVTGVFLAMKYEVAQFLKQQQEQDKNNNKQINVDQLDHTIQPNDYYLHSHPYSIINTSSVLGRIAFPNISAYVASKHAVEGLTKVAALDYAKRGIRINALDYGFVWSEMSEGFSGPGMAKMVRIGRVGQAEEAAEVAAFLASNASSYIHGASIDVSGGALA